jgi:hypothetical protein
MIDKEIDVLHPSILQYEPYELLQDTSYEIDICISNESSFAYDFSISCYEIYMFLTHGMYPKMLTHDIPLFFLFILNQTKYPLLDQ